jgi:hypothetical protein
MRFSIRDVLWLTVVVALAVGWSLDGVQFRREQANARRAELRVRQAAEQALYAAKIVEAHAAVAREMEAQRRSTATDPDPQAIQPAPPSTAP